MGGSNPNNPRFFVLRQERRSNPLLVGCFEHRLCNDVRVSYSVCFLLHVYIRAFLIGIALPFFFLVLLVERVTELLVKCLLVVFHFILVVASSPFVSVIIVTHPPKINTVE